MGEIDAGALPVGDDNRLVGILSLGDIAVVAGRRAAGEALAGISQPGGAHSQTIGLS
jgi:CBS domain-containing protein